MSPSRLEGRSDLSLVCRSADDAPAESPALRTSSGRASVHHPSHVQRLRPEEIEAERARATRDLGAGEAAIGDVIRDLDRSDFAVVKLRGFMKAGVHAEVEETAIVRHEPDDTWVVELSGKAAVGLGEGAGAEAVGEGGARLRFHTPEAAADFLQAVGSGAWGADRALGWTRDRAVAVMGGAGIKLEAGTDHGGLGKELAILGKLGLELEGGLSATIDLERGELVLAGRLEGAGVAKLTSPWVHAMKLGGQLKLEAKVEHRVKLDRETLDDVLHGRRQFGELALEGKTVLKVEGQADVAATATLAGAAALVKLEGQVDLGVVKDLSIDRLSHAVAEGELAVQVFTSKEKDVGGLDVDALVAGGGFSWRAHRLAAEHTTTLGDAAKVVSQALAELGTSLSPRRPYLEAVAASCRAAS